MLLRTSLVGLLLLSLCLVLRAYSFVSLFRHFHFFFLFFFFNCMFCSFASLPGLTSPPPLCDSADSHNIPGSCVREACGYPV
ncbi:hypothetical protein LY78DRAFT_663064 [Colletotrichum sublineola]|nr:hypothetical protein LY78DRAFT_663064 [Colletotrichum sublineola]